MTNDPTPSTDSGDQFGIAENTSDNFRSIVHFLAVLPQYADLPLFRLPDLDRSLQQGRVMCARRKGLLAGVAAWTHLTDELALQCIERRAMPKRAEVTHSGDAVLLMVLGTSVEGLAAPLSRAVFAAQTGRIVIYERIQEGLSPEERFVWLDRRGVRLGDALTVDTGSVH
jgi:hypothetical protein